MADFEDFEFPTAPCDYYDLSSVTCERFCNSYMHLNVRSLLHKVAEMEGLLNLFGHPKVLMLTETWLTLDSALLEIPDYTFVSSPRLLSRGGGVGAYIHKSLPYVIKDTSCNTNFQCHNIDFLLIELLNNISICCIYCPPNSKVVDIIAVVEHMKSLLNSRSSLIIGGDFNIDFLVSTDLPLDFLNSLHALSLHPIISLPTRVSDSSSSIIDNFLCDISLLPLRSSVIKTDISDHYLIEMSLSVTTSDNSIRRNLSPLNMSKFSTKLRNADWSRLYSIEDVDVAFNYFLKKLKRIYSKCFPFEIAVYKPNKNLWLTPSILKSIRYKNKLFLKSKTNSDLKPVYKNYRNQLTTIIRFAKLNHHKHLLDQLKNNSAKMWTHLNSLINIKRNNNTPISAEGLNNYFTSVFNQAPKFQPGQLHTIPDSSFIANSFFLNPTSYNEIISTMASLSNSCAIGVDGICPKLIKCNASLLARQLAYIYNLSFSQGVFPILLKTAIVIPVYKNGSHLDPGNYRPISLLTTFSKLLEKLFNNRMLSFINEHNILHDNQFGFIKNKSTTLAIANVLSSIISKHNNNNKIVFALLDLKKAFDFINHDLLLVKLRHYGIRGLPLLWLSSYLTNRSQRVKVNNICSTVSSITAGVPQGSILGPLLFNLFINDVFQFNSPCSEIYLYADDTAIIFSSDSNTNLQAIVNNFFATYCNWCMQNCIVVNPVKSNFLTFNSSNITVSLNGHFLDNPKFVRYLGVFIDDKLLWSNHVSYVTKMCCQRIGIFRKILPCLPNYVVILYYNAFIRSCFSYCLMFWFGNNRSGRHKLIDKIDNLICKLLSKLHINQLVQTANVSFCNTYDVYKMQCLSFMYDICHNTIYLPYFPMVTNNIVHSHFTRTSCNIHIASISSLEKRNFIYNCMLTWNACLPANRLLSKSAFIYCCKINLNNIDI